MMLDLAKAAGGLAPDMLCGRVIPRSSVAQHHTGDTAAAALTLIGLGKDSLAKPRFRNRIRFIISAAGSCGRSMKQLESGSHRAAAMSQP